MDTSSAEEIAIETACVLRIGNYDNYGRKEGELEIVWKKQDQLSSYHQVGC